MEKVDVRPPKISLPMEKEDTGISIETEKEESESNSFFRRIIDHLFSPANVSAKTEYLDEAENLYGSMLEFISVYADIPSLAEFVRTFETKRISLKRQGRIEIVKSLERRQEEVDFQRQQQFNQGLRGML